MKQERKNKKVINKRLERMLNELNTEKRIRESEKENERKMKEIEKIKLKRKIENEIKKYAAGTEGIEYVLNGKVVTKEEFINYIANKKFKKKNKRN